MPPIQRRQHHHRDIDEVIGAAVRDLRTDRGWTMEAMAQRMAHFGWLASTVAKVETGERSMRAAELLWLSAGHDLDVGPLSEDVAALVEEASGEAPADRDATARAARSLGMSVRRLDNAAQRLWGHDFATERRKRANLAEVDALMDEETEGTPIPRGLLGHVTREIMAEIKKETRK